MADLPPYGQTYVERPPAAPLAGRVASVWVQQIGADATPYRHRSLPTGGIDLVWQLGRAPQIVGPSTGPLVQMLAPGTTVVGLRFRPGAAASILDRPAAELRDIAVDVDALWPQAGRLADECPLPGAAAVRLQQLVADRLGEADDPDPLIADAVRLLMPWRFDEVRDVTAQLYISERHLRRRCLDAVGLSPKALHRTLRFQGFLALVQSRFVRHRPGDERLDGLAVEAGYADQAHLTRECQRLAGTSPRVFVDEARQHCAHGGHDHAVSYAPLLRSRPQSRRP